MTVEHAQMSPPISQADTADGHVLTGETERSADTCIDAGLYSGGVPSSLLARRLARRLGVGSAGAPDATASSSNAVSVSRAWAASADFEGYSSRDMGLPGHRQ